MNITELCDKLWDEFNVICDFVIKLLKQNTVRMVAFLIILVVLLKCVVVLCNKLKRGYKKNNIKENVENIKENVKSMRKSGYLDINYFYKLPNNLICKKLLWKILFSVGISLFLTDETLRKLLGRYLVLEPMALINNRSDEISIQLEKIEILANKDTRVFVKITNNTGQNVNFKKHFQNSTVNKFIRDNISLKINGKYDIDYEDTDSKNFYKSGQVTANTSNTIQLVFNKLSDRLIRRIEEVEFEYRIPKLRKPKENMCEIKVSEKIELFKVDKVEEHYNYISEDDYELFLQIGGFLIIPILMLFFISILNLYSKLLFILNVFMFVLCINLNHKLLELIDTKRIRKNRNVDRKQEIVN